MTSPPLGNRGVHDLDIYSNIITVLMPMPRHTGWRRDAILSVKLRDNLYTLAQMRVNYLMQFFDVRSSDGQWRDIDLNVAPRLFCIYVAECWMRPILDSFVNTWSVKRDERPIPRLMLSGDPAFSSKYECYIDLVELDDNYEPWDAEVLKRRLTPITDADDLRRHELTRMWGNPDELARRLIRYFDTGVDWDESKSYIFGDDLQPPLKP
jgi:hypothetical protein